MTQVPSKAEVLRKRKEYCLSSLKLSYASSEGGKYMTRGKGCFLIDDKGVPHLDCVNNVSHIGHSNTLVSQAAHKQIQVLNTNNRYAYPHLGDYCEQLVRFLQLPTLYHDCESSWKVCLVNSGSEANELAIRMLRQRMTLAEQCGNQEMSEPIQCERNKIIVLRDCYHGNTGQLIGLSTYKCESQTHTSLALSDSAVVFTLPERPIHSRKGCLKWSTQYSIEDDKEYTEKCVQSLRELLLRDHLASQVCGMLVESVIGCAGQVFLPKGLLRGFADVMRELDIPLVCDEVQTGLGRLGFPFRLALQHNSGMDFAPDIITLGKPLGNGFPLSAVICSNRIADDFYRSSRGMQYFNTFGGNPLACAVGSAVLNELCRDDFNLMRQACEVGRYWLESLQQSLEPYYPGIVRDIRGVGLFLGIEFVNPKLAESLVSVLCAPPFCILLSTDGPLENVIKMKPPLCFSKENARFMVESLCSALEKMVPVNSSKENNCLSIKSKL